MRFRPTAVGYLRSDISGVRLAWDEERIRSHARRLGYDFAKVVVVDGRSSPQPVAGLKATIVRLEAEAVVVPSIRHFEGGAVPGDLVNLVDVITLEPEETFVRWANPPSQAENR
ncbi:hypothetical protein [Nocardia sp. NBC_00511]|uniref:hypothetical protein n=1 Tax=Nocardia sp. NBC_00511 TaxID=2903591 RepID=UPI0030E215B8